MGRVALAMDGLMGGVLTADKFNVLFSVLNLFITSRVLLTLLLTQ